MPSFDQVGDDYERALRQNLRFVPGGVDYYYENRVAIAREVTSEISVRNILDFGGGIGLTVPHLMRAFPGTNITLCDESSESANIARQRHRQLQVSDSSNLPDEMYDLIFVAGVIHHIAPSERPGVVSRLCRALRPGGALAVFELNPLNPVTRRLVSCCPFDKDASLLKKSDLEALLINNHPLRPVADGYTVFVPPILRVLRPIERFLRWCPLGAQYFVALQRAT